MVFSCKVIIISFFDVIISIPFGSKEGKKKGQKGRRAKLEGAFVEGA